MVMNTTPANKRHHTPQGFRNNYVASVTKSLGEVLRWRLGALRNRLPPPPTLPIPETEPELPFMLQNAVAGADMVPAVTWVGHATMLVQASGLNVLTDPIFSSRASPVQFAGPTRHQCPGVALDQLPHIDVVVISHNHYDHLDRASVIALARQAGGPPLFLVPLGLRRWLARAGIGNAIELDWWDSHVCTAADGRRVEFHFTPAQHWSARSLGDRNKTLWGAWAVLGEDCHWFFTGDSGYSQDFADARARFAARQTEALGGGFDIALIAVGACLPRWFMQLQHVDLDEAVQLHLDLGAKSSVGIHWGTFELTDEPLDQPLHGLDGARRAKGVAAEAFFLLPIGGTRKVPPRSYAK